MSTQVQPLSPASSAGKDPGKRTKPSSEEDQLNQAYENFARDLLEAKERENNIKAQLEECLRARNLYKQQLAETRDLVYRLSQLVQR